MAVADHDALQGAKHQQHAHQLLAVNNSDNITEPVKSKEISPIPEDNIEDVAESALNNESMDDLRHLLHLDKLIQPSPPTDITAIQQEASQNEETRLPVPELETTEETLITTKAFANPPREFSKHWLPMLPLRSRRDEGIEFPDHADRLQHLLLMKAENESINLDEYCVQLLQNENTSGMATDDVTRILPMELVELLQVSALNYQRPKLTLCPTGLLSR